MYPSFFKLTNKERIEIKVLFTRPQSCKFRHYPFLLNLKCINSQEQPKKNSFFFEIHADHMPKSTKTGEMRGKKYCPLNYSSCMNPPSRKKYKSCKKFGKLLFLKNSCPKSRFSKKCDHPYAKINAAVRYKLKKRLQRNPSRLNSAHKKDDNLSRRTLFVNSVPSSHDHVKQVVIHMYIVIIFNCYSVKPGADAKLNICLDPHHSLLYLFSTFRNSRSWELQDRGQPVISRLLYKKKGENIFKSDTSPLKHRP